MQTMQHIVDYQISMSDVIRMPVTANKLSVRRLIFDKDEGISHGCRQSGMHQLRSLRQTHYT